MARCAICRRKADEGARFCTGCGQHFESGGVQGAEPGKTREYQSDSTKALLSAAAEFPVLVRIGAENEEPIEKWLTPGDFKIGRAAGDWVFANDRLMSSLHATLEIAVNDQPPSKLGESLWIVKISDRSTNGTFRRTREPVKIVDGLCCMIGDTLLDWKAAEGAAVPAGGGKKGHTQEMKRGRGAPVLFNVTVSGPDGDRKYPVSGAITIGSKAADLLLDDEFVSEHHADLVFEEDGCYLKDAGSLNGVFVQIDKEKGCLLADTDGLRMGAQLFRFELRAV